MVLSPVRTRKSKSNTPINHSDSSVCKPSPLIGDYGLQDNSLPCTPVTRADASFRNDDKISPMLAKLRMTPGRLLKEKQSLLVRKHEETRRKVDSLNIGGGVSIWPEMDSMRLTMKDVKHLILGCVILIAVTVASFLAVHGQTISKLLEFYKRLAVFSSNHKICVDNGQSELDQSLVIWHQDYKKIVDEIHSEFDIHKLPALYIIYILVYIITLCVLFYYLLDNMFAKSKLSPKRIRRWVCLLVFTAVWTCLLGVCLLLALRTETMIEHNVHNLSNTLASVIPTDLSFDKFNIVLHYWCTRCLPPTTHGIISIFGLISIRDVTFYLQYYSLPIGTVLLTPVFRLIVSLMTIYNIRDEKKS
ncbi:hypothetical protein ACF0H5_013032 [Mactra antiquata]